MTRARLGQYLAERLQDLVLESADVQDFLQELSVFSAGFIGKTTGLPVLCGVTLVRSRRSVASAGSAPGARLLEEIQRATGLGPSLAALESGAAVSVPDARADSRWPRYDRAVVKAGQLSLLALPLPLDPGGAAAIAFFAPEAGAFDDEAIVICEAFAARAAKAVRLAVRIGALNDLNDDLLEALNSRTSINLASGIVMGQSRCSQAEAFAILSRVSSNRNIKVRVVAEDLLRSFNTSPGAAHFKR